MGFFFNRRKSHSDDDVRSNNARIDVVALKNKQHKTAEEANQEIARLNKVLLKNGITLQISIAAGGKHPSGH